MNLIYRILWAGAAFYAGVALLQATLGTGLWLQAGAVAVLIAVVSLLMLVRDERLLKTTEMRVLWVCVLGFLLYAAGRAGGVI
ncbi:MAG: hypothetical protein APR53_05530 [Methanoculleus sp. SDB]|nr:MAG: hypothetical protein APR53_05530 [Methanoculleus sp. SDB]